MLPEVTVPSRAGRSHIRYLQACVDSLYCQDETAGGAGLLHSALQQWQRARRMLDEADYSETAGRDLLVVAGNLAVCTGWLAFDAGNAPLARQLLSEARLLAGSAGDTVLATHALAELSGYTSWMARMYRNGGLAGKARGSARESLRLASQAADEARHERSPRLHVMIALRLSNATSLLGDNAAFRSAISRARRELDHTPGADDPCRYRADEKNIAHDEALGHVNLGDAGRGEQLYRSVLDGEVPPLWRAYTGAALADSLLQQGARDDAVTEGLNALSSLEDGVKSVRSLVSLRLVRAAAQEQGSEEFCTRFDAAERALTAV